MYDNAKFFVLAAIGLCAACISLAQTPTLIQHVSGSGTLHELVSAGGSYNIPLPNATLLKRPYLRLSIGQHNSSGSERYGRQKQRLDFGASVTDTTHKAVSAIYYALK